jgi:hypothetical protein
MVNNSSIKAYFTLTIRYCYRYTHIVGIVYDPLSKLEYHTQRGSEMVSSSCSESGTRSVTRNKIG